MALGRLELEIPTNRWSKTATSICRYHWRLRPPSIQVVVAAMKCARSISRPTALTLVFGGFA